MSNVIVVSTTLIKTTARDGDVRLWGVCSECAHVDELSCKQTSLWEGLCETCADDLRELRRETKRALSQEWQCVS